MTTKTLRDWIEWAEEIADESAGDDFGQYDIPLDDTEGNFERFKQNK